MLNALTVCIAVTKFTFFLFFITLAKCLADSKATLIEKRSVGIDAECCASEEFFLENSGGELNI